MKGILRRGLPLFLSCLMLLCACPVLPVAAASGSERFIFSALTSSGDESYPFGELPVSLTLSPEENEFRADVLSPMEKGNAFYISLVNTSTATALEITYTFMTGGNRVTQRTTGELLPGSESAQVLILPAPHLDEEAAELTLRFVGEGELSGTVKLQAFFDYTTFLPESYTDHLGTPLATLSTCHFNAESNEIEIEGKISHATSANYPREEYYLALFALSAGEDLYLSRKTPLIRSEMALDFSFKVPVESADDLFSRYVIAAVDRRHGASVPLYAPVYPAVFGTEAKGEEAFKGFHTDSFSALLDSTPGIEFVDVYLDLLQTEQTTDVLYVGEHSYYYFDSKYVAELDRRVRNLVGQGCHVYLRFLINADANHVSFADYCNEESGVINKMPTLRTEQAQRDLRALTDFLSNRYADDRIGRISGILLGRAADRADIYNFADVSDLSEYVTLYAATLHLVAATTRQNIPGAGVLVPLSDRIWGEQYPQNAGNGEYYATLLLPTLCMAYDAQTLSDQGFSLLLESSHTPGCVGVTDTSRYGVERLDLFRSVLARYSARYPFLSNTLIYSWQPDASLSSEALKAAYLWQYYALSAADGVSSFMVDLSLAGEQEEKMTEALRFLVRFVDTDRAEAAAATALKTLGFSSLSELASELQTGVDATRKVHSASLGVGEYASGVTALGSYGMWNFRGATTTLDWYAGVGCGLLSVLGNQSSNRALVAEMAGDAAYADIAYHFNTPVDLSFAPLLAAKLCVDGTAGARYEVQLRLIGEEDTVLATAIVTAGEEQRLLLDLGAQSEALSKLRSVRILTRPLEGSNEDYKLLLYSLDLESATLTTEELEQRIDEIRKNAAGEQEQPEQHRDIALPLIVTGIIFLASAAIVVLLIIPRKQKRRV